MTFLDIINLRFELGGYVVSYRLKQQSLNLVELSDRDLLLLHRRFYSMCMTYYYPSIIPFINIQNLSNYFIISPRQIQITLRDVQT